MKFCPVFLAATLASAAFCVADSASGLAGGDGPPQLPKELLPYKEYLTAPGLDLSMLTSWNELTSLRAGVGYKDNVALSSFEPEGSPYITSGLDFSLSRLLPNSSEFSYLITGDDVRYLDSAATKNEDLFVVAARWKGGLGADWKPSLNLQYTYQDEIVDASSVPGQLVSARATGHAITLRPDLAYSFTENYWMEVQLPATRQFYAAPLDGYWQAGPQLILGRKGDQLKELSLSYEVSKILFDTRRQSDLSGVLIPNSALDLWEQKTELRAELFLDRDRRWSMISRLGFDHDTDNGSGYFDFFTYRAAQELLFHAGSWKVKGLASYAHYYFPSQSGDETGSKQYEDIALFNIRAEKRFGKRFTVFAEYGYDWSLSNRSVDNYKANNINAGVEIEF